MSFNSVCNHIRNLTGRSSDFVITRMSTDRIGLHSVLLPLLIFIQMAFFLHRYPMADNEESFWILHVYVFWKSLPCFILKMERYFASWKYYRASLAKARARAVKPPETSRQVAFSREVRTHHNCSWLVSLASGSYHSTWDAAPSPTIVIFKKHTWYAD